MNSSLICDACEESGWFHCSEEVEGYFLRCGQCGYLPSGIAHTDSSGPHEEADQLAEWQEEVKEDE